MFGIHLLAAVAVSYFAVVERGGGQVGLVIANGRIVILAYRIIGNSNRQGWGVTTGSGATLVGSIVNATGKKLFSPSGLS